MPGWRFGAAAGKLGYNYQCRAVVSQGKLSVAVPLRETTQPVMLSAAKHLYRVQ